MGSSAGSGLDVVAPALTGSDAARSPQACGPLVTARATWLSGYSYRYRVAASIGVVRAATIGLVRSIR